MTLRVTKKNFISILLYALVIIFFAIYLQGIDYKSLQSIAFQPQYLLVASVVSILFRYWGVVVWRTILKDLGAHNLPSFRILAFTYAKSWMARYIPGTVTWIASKVYIAKDVGISKSRLTVSSLLEAGIQISALTSVSLIIFVFDTRINSLPVTLRLLAFLVGALSIIVLLPPVFNRITKHSLRLLKKTIENNEAVTNGKAVLHSYFLYAVGAFISGASYFFITKSVEPSVGISEFFYITAAYNLAGVLGMMTPFVPSGLGVRDGAQLLLLSVIFPKEIALVLTIISRLWTAVIDIMFFIITLIANRKTRSMNVEKSS